MSDHKKQFEKTFKDLSYRHNKWTAWSDFVTMAACSLSLLDFARREERGQLYEDTAKRYTAAELALHNQLFEVVVQALTDDPNQDFLGELYMMLELGNKNTAQFFTPYNVCQMTARIQGGDIAALVEKDGYVTVNDPAVGAGALLIAFANECKRLGVNYQKHVLFVGQDIDYVVGMMCFIQLSLLGCPGHVTIGNSLMAEEIERRNIWYTPMYYLSPLVRKGAKKNGPQETQVGQMAGPSGGKKEQSQLREAGG